MSRIQRFRPTGAAVLAGVVIGTLALAGCGAGQITQTSSQQPAVVGANAGTGPVVVRDAQIEFPAEARDVNLYPRGGAAPLSMSIVNSGLQADRLVSASSPAAASVQLSGETQIPPGRVLLISGGPEGAAAPNGTAQPGATAAAGAEPTAAEPTAAAAPTAAAPTAAAPTPAAPTPAAPTGAASPALGSQLTGQIVLTGLTEDIRAGLTYPVVLNFERAGQITVGVPVGYPDAPRKDEHTE